MSTLLEKHIFRLTYCYIAKLLYDCTAEFAINGFVEVLCKSVILVNFGTPSF